MLVTLYLNSGLIMKRRTVLLLFLLAAVAAPAWAQAPAAGETVNPLLKEWTTPFQVPPFQEIKPEHFLPAIKEGLAAQRKEIQAIVDNPQPPTFENTILALENAGELLSKVQGVFGTLQGAETNPDLQRVNREASPLLTAARDEIALNPKLFARVKAVYDQRDTSKLGPLQKKLVEETYKGYVRGGANLDAAKKDQLTQDQRRALDAGIKFGDNLLHDTNSYQLVIDKQEDLKGLPPSVVASGADAAKAARMPGKWVFTLQAPSIWPFLQYADNRELRRQILAAYTTRGDHSDAARQQGDRRAHRRAARRARQPARLQDPRRLRPRGEHGEGPRRACTAC